MTRPFHIGAQNDALYIISGERPAAAGNDYPRHDADRTCVALVYDEAEARRLVAPMTAAQIKEQWESTFSTGNPFCPCDLRSFTKAARAIERAHGIAG